MAISDEELVERIKTGDRRAADELVGRYQGLALSLARHFSRGDRSWTEDLVQEAFVKVFRGLSGFKGQSAFKTWFHRVVINTCLDDLRRRKRRERVLSLWPLRRKENDLALEESLEASDQGQTHNPLRALGSKELGREVERRLAGLPERQRLVFQLKVVQGLKLREIADILGMAEGTAKSHLFRATRALRAGLEAWSET